MGNSTSNTVAAKNRNVPIKPILKRPQVPVPGPVNGYYNQYPIQYMPEQYYYYPAYPENYPVVSNETYLRNQFYPETRLKSKAVEQQIPTHYPDTHRSAHPSHHSHHHHHHSPPSHSHHHHHHHHRSRISSPPLTIREYVSPLSMNERSTSPLPPVHQTPAVPVQKPVSTVTTYKIKSPLVNEEKLSPTPPMHHSAAVVTQKPLAPVFIEKPISPTVAQRYISSTPILLKRISPSLSAASNTFDKAPIMDTNYVAKSTDNNSISTYGPGPMTIVRRTSMQSGMTSNRWYDHDFDKRVKPLTVKNV